MTYLLSTSSKATTSLLVKSMASLLLMLSSDRIWAALALPIPCMYWSANLRGLLSGISIPALILRHRAPTPWNCIQNRRLKDDHDKYQHIKSVTFQISKLRIWGMINFSYSFSFWHNSWIIGCFIEMYNGKQRIQNQNYAFAFSISYKSLLSIISTNAYKQATLVAYAMFYLLPTIFHSNQTTYK